jgi:hypothetical protein
MRRGLIASLVAAAAGAGCHPSASVENTMPVANLKSYGTVGLRVSSRSPWARTLEADVGAQLRAQCGFTQIGRVGPTPSDVIVDLNITAMGRGGTSSFIRNPNEATIDTLLVLTDGHTSELLGTARIHGSSSGVSMNGAMPEQEAVDVVAKAVADLLAKSGCAGPRVARAEPPPPPPQPPPAGSNAPPPIDDAKRAQADALNEQGTEKLQTADSDGALAAFQQANLIAPDARYEFNACLALETLSRWDDAIAACKQAKTLNPQPRLATKIDQRLDVLAHHQ